MIALVLLAPFVTAELPPWLELDAEYRVRTQYVDPLDLSGTRVKDVDWTEQRARVGAALKHGNWFALRTRMDILDGALWGDNGTLAREPYPNSGVSLASKRPNNTGYDVSLRPDADPLDKDSYEPRLKQIEPIEIDHIFADITLPVGLLRIGRQPTELDYGLGAHSGDRLNRWGVSNFADTSDRILFATKIDEAIHMLMDPTHRVNPSIEEGVILALWGGLGAQGELHVADDNLTQLGGALIWRRPFLAAGAGISDILVSQAAVHAGGDDFETDIWAFPSKLRATVEDRVRISFLSLVIHGETRELSEGTAPLRNVPARIQEVDAFGMQALADVFVGPVTLTLEFDWASGDEDPRGETPITSMNFPRDLNVGLLLFERVLAFQSARAAAVGVENLRNLDAPSLPITEVSTEGRFTNAKALFPQVKVDLVETDQHRLHTRLGALFAWTDVGVVDPVQTLLAEDGERVDDDAVNFNGGDPGGYYGTELDFQIEWAFREAFLWTIEVAYLLPGDALEDENGDAVDAFFFENRFTFVF